MVIELKGEAEATVLRMAEASGLTPSEVVAQELAHSSWQEDAEEQAVHAERIADADREDFVRLSSKEVARRLGIIVAAK